MVKNINIIYASTSGHTEYVVDHLKNYLQQKSADLKVTVKRAEQANDQDLLQGDILILASGTWNLGGVAGQLNPHMHELLNKKAKDTDLNGRKAAIISLGDSRYYYTARATEHLQKFIRSRNGEVFGIPLVIINEPYGQEEKIEKWGEKFLTGASGE